MRKQCHQDGSTSQRGGCCLVHATNFLSVEGKRAIPFGMRSEGCPFLPVFAGNSIQIPDEKTISHREFAGQLFMALEPTSQTIHEAEVSLLYSQHGYVGRSSHRKVPELLVLNFLSRIPC